HCVRRLSTPHSFPTRRSSDLILVGLFLLQSRGTARIGALFGPVMLVWFGTIGVLGLSEIVRQPGVLAAVSPYHAVLFFGENLGRGFVVLGAVFLVVTGGEALYADLGHFGHRAIQIAWFTVPLPCLLLNSIRHQFRFPFLLLSPRRSRTRRIP